MKENIKKYQSVVAFLILPIFYMIYGIQLARSYTPTQWSIAFLFYFFILLNQFLHALFRKMTTTNFTISTKSFITMELINLILIYMLYYNTGSYLMLFILFFYSISSQLMFYFNFYPVIYSFFVVCGEVFFNVILLNAISQYLQIGFFSLKIITSTIPFILCYSWMLANKWKLPLSVSIQWSWILSLSLLSALFYFKQISYWLFLLLILLPFIRKAIHEKNDPSAIIWTTILFGTLTIFSMV